MSNVDEIIESQDGVSEWVYDESFNEVQLAHNDKQADSIWRAIQLAILQRHPPGFVSLQKLY